MTPEKHLKLTYFHGAETKKKVKTHFDDTIRYVTGLTLQEKITYNFLDDDLSTLTHMGINRKKIIN